MSENHDPFDKLHEICRELKQQAEQAEHQRDELRETLAQARREFAESASTKNTDQLRTERDEARQELRDLKLAIGLKSEMAQLAWPLVVGLGQRIAALEAACWEGYKLLDKVVNYKIVDEPKITAWLAAAEKLGPLWLATPDAKAPDA
jgi:hypothetical protein